MDNLPSSSRRVAFRVAKPSRAEFAGIGQGVGIHAEPLGRELPADSKREFCPVARAGEPGHDLAVVDRDWRGAGVGDHGRGRDLAARRDRLEDDRPRSAKQGRRDETVRDLDFRRRGHDRRAAAAIGSARGGLRPGSGEHRVDGEVPEAVVRRRQVQDEAARALVRASWNLSSRPDRVVRPRRRFAPPSDHPGRDRLARPSPFQRHVAVSPTVLARTLAQSSRRSTDRARPTVRRPAQAITGVYQVVPCEGDRSTTWPGAVRGTHSPARPSKARRSTTSPGPLGTGSRERNTCTTPRSGGLHSIRTPSSLRLRVASTTATIGADGMHESIAPREAIIRPSKVL